MRFSLLRRQHIPPALAPCEAVGRGVGIRWRQRTGLVVLLILVFASLATVQFAAGQPPGTPPPQDVFNGDEDRLPVRAFLFLNESENPVMMPGMKWEDFERAMDLESGVDGAERSFGYQSLEITGSTDEGRAELEVVLRLSIEPTGGRSVAIPLRMGNFHRLAPPDVSGLGDDYRMKVASDGSGYVLMVRTDTPREAMLRMRVSSRVEMNSTRSLEFRLPDVPSRVELTTDADKVSGEVVGRGDETIQTRTVEGGRTAFSIDSSGGTFSLRWGRLARSTADIPLLEVESRITARWDSPQDQPIVSARMTVRNAKGSIDGFQLRLPSGSVMLDSPTLGTGGRTIEIGAATKDRDGEVREVVIPEDERQQRIDLNFDLQLANDSASSNSPLGFRAPEIVGALRHRGEVVIATGGDYRLRWRPRPWVRSELGESQEEGAIGRTYRFRFDRGSFELPIWLSAKERQLRLASNAEIAISDTVASLDMTILVSGQLSDGRLQFDDGSWRINSIENLETGEQIESFRSDAYRVIEFNAATTEDPTSIRILAELPIKAELGAIEFTIPRVVEIDDNVLVQNATLDIVNSGRTLLVLDLPASSGLSRLMPSAKETADNSVVSRFRVLAQDSPARVVGTLVEQPPRITLSSDATIELEGDQLLTTVDWAVISPLDLEGVLPVRIPKFFESPPAETRPAEMIRDAQVESTARTLVPETRLDRRDGATASLIEPWVVTVDGVPATLQSIEDDRFELISDRLASGSMLIRWQHAQRRKSTDAGVSIESVSLPRPNIADVTVRGAMRVSLRGNQQLDLTSVDSPSSTELELDTLPRDPVRLRLQSRATIRDELSIRQAVLRTVVGRSTRHEQVVATIQGGDNFRVGLPDQISEISVEAFIDGNPEAVRREGDTLVISLPGDELSHVVDLRVWITIGTRSTFAVIEPTLTLPVGVGRVFWQIVAPLDGHVVWASPTIGRSMTWHFDRWKLYREPSHSDQALTAMSGATPNSLPDGNRYLYVGSDLRSFEVIIVSRAMLWLFIGSFVFSMAVLLTNFPKSRHPLTAVAVAILYGGLLAIAPDAAVLAGQFGIISLVLVIVMIAIRALLTPGASDRVFSSRSSSQVLPSSTRTIQKKLASTDQPSVASTQALPPPPSHSEASL